MAVKHPIDSKTVVTSSVLPSETNAIHTLFGGELLARMDRTASIAAQRHSESVVVTASVNHVAFNIQSLWEVLSPLRPKYQGLLERLWKSI